MGRRPSVRPRAELRLLLRQNPLSDSTSAWPRGRASDCTWAGRGLVLNDSTSVQAGDLVSDSTCVGAGRGQGLGLSDSAVCGQGWGGAK